MRLPGVLSAETPGELPAQHSRKVLAQRPVRRLPASPILEAQAKWDGARTTLGAFTRQVLMRPMRIGTLVLLGGLTATVLVGAEGWWIVLGITLFHASASTLTVMWVDVPPSARAVEPPGTPAWSSLGEVPQQRRPGPGE